MSLVTLALRIATVKALRGATYAGERVYDSAMDPIDVTVEQAQALPVVVVYTDDDEPDIHGKDLMGAPRNISLVIETVVASKVEASDGQDTVVIPHTDAGLEATLAFMGRQVSRALLAQDSDWSRLWRDLVTDIPKCTIRRGAGSEKGARFAARQIVYTVDTLAEPYFGQELEDDDYWSRFLTAMEADTDLAPMAGIMRAEIEDPALNPAQQAAASLGITAKAAAAIGLSDVIPWGDPNDPADVGIEIAAGRLGEDGELLTSEDADNALPPEDAQ